MLSATKLSDLQRIDLFVNSGKLTLAQIKAQYAAHGEQIKIINGGLFTMRTFKPNCHLTVNGKVLATPDPPYSCYGMAWNTAADFGMSLIPCDKQNVISCCALIENGVPVAKPIYDKAQGGSRGRTAIGTKDGQVMLYCSQDGRTSDLTPEELRGYLVSQGWQTAVMLDCGGSCQCDCGLGKVIVSSRIVHNFIVFVLKPTGCPYIEPSKALRYGNVNTGVKWLQWRLNDMGFDCGLVDGWFGRKTLTALLAFQRANKLVQDGICGPATKTAIRRKYG